MILERNLGTDAKKPSSAWCDAHKVSGAAGRMFEGFLASGPQIPLHSLTTEKVQPQPRPQPKTGSSPAIHITEHRPQKTDYTKSQRLEWLISLLLRTTPKSLLRFVDTLPNWTMPIVFAFSQTLMNSNVSI